MPQRIGFIGLGIMGRPMAKNLLQAGFALTAYNRSRPPLDDVVAAGAQAAASPRAVAECSDVVIIIVTDSPDVQSVLLGPDGVIEAARRGLIVVDMSTISPQVTRDIAAKLAAKGASMLDAPVSGGEQGAIAATLAIMVGGDAATFQECLSVFQALGQKIVHCGPVGMGQTVKLCNQVVVALNNLAMSEALVLAARAGVDLAKMVEVVSSGAAASWAMANLAPKVLRRDFAPGFKVGLQQKDLRLALEAARSLNLPLPGTALVHQLYAAVEAAGLADEGNHALVKALEALAEVTVGG